MADINSIIEMVEKTKERRADDMYRDACDDIIGHLSKMEDREPELRRCLKNLVEVTRHLNLCPGVMSECEDILK